MRLAIGLPLYIASSGPVAWATNDGFHRRILPDQINLIYLPLQPIARIRPFGEALCWWTILVWHGYPAGYTTL